MDMFETTVNGIRIIGPRKPKKDAYIRVSATVVTDQYPNANDAWDAGVSAVYDIYGAIPTEDGTVGQAVQTMKIPANPKDHVFSFGLNLYGKPARKLHARIAERVGIPK